jgi:hypothetical protein
MADLSNALRISTAPSGAVPVTAPGALRVGEAPDISVLNDQDAAASMGQLRRGFTSGLYGADANAMATDESALRASGRVAEADALRAEIALVQRRAATFAPAEQDVTKLGWEPGRALDYGLGAVGQAASSMVQPAAAEVVLGGAGKLISGIKTKPTQAIGAGLQLAGPAAAGLLNYRQNKGEFYNDAVEDPNILRNHTAQEIDRMGTGHGLVAGAMDTALPHMIAGRVLGKPGLKALDGLSAPLKIGGDMLMEGGTEVGQGMVKRAALGQLNPQRDTGGDSAEAWNDFAGGVLGAGPMSGASHLVAAGHARLGVKGDGEVGDELKNGGKGTSRPSASLPESLAAGAKAKADQLPSPGAEAWRDILTGQGQGGTFEEDVALQRDSLVKELTVRSARGDVAAKQHLDAVLAQNPADPTYLGDDAPRMAAAEHLVGDGTSPEANQRLIAAYANRKLNEQRGPRLNEQESAPDGFVRGADMVGKTLEDRAARNPDSPADAEAIVKYREVQQRSRLTAAVMRDAVPEGKPPQFKQIAADLGREIAQFASQGYAKPTPGDMQRVLRIGQQMVRMYGRKAADIATQVGRTSGADGSKLHKLLLGSVVLARDSVHQFQQKSAIERSTAADQLAAVIPPYAEQKLRTAGLDLTTPEGRESLLDHAEAFFDNESDRPAKEFLATFGKAGVEAMRQVVGQRIEPRTEIDTKTDEKPGQEKAVPEKTAKQSKESDDGLQGDMEEGDNWQLDGALKNIERAPGSKLYKFAGMNAVGVKDGEHPFKRGKGEKGEPGKFPRLVSGDEVFHGDDKPALRKMEDQTHEALGTVVGTKRVVKQGDGVLKHTNENADKTGGTRVRSVSAREVMDDRGVKPVQRVRLLRDYLAQGVKGKPIMSRDDPTIPQLATLDRKIAEMKASTPKELVKGVSREGAATVENPKHAELRELISQRREVAAKLAAKIGVEVDEDASVHDIADAYFDQRFLVVAEQMAEKDQLRLDVADVRQMTDLGKRYLNKSDQFGEDKAAVQADMNLIRFKSLMATSKDGISVIPAGELVAWVLKNRNGFRKREVNTDVTSALDFRNALMEGIGALVADGHASELPFMVNEHGDEMSFARGIPGWLKLGKLSQYDLNAKANEKLERREEHGDEPIVGPQHEDPVALEQDQGEKEQERRAARNTDPDELLDQGQEAKRLARNSTRYWDEPAAAPSEVALPTNPDLKEVGPQEPVLTGQQTLEGFELPEVEPHQPSIRPGAVGVTRPGQKVDEKRSGRYPVAPETEDTRSGHAGRVPSEMEPREQKQGAMPIDRTELAQRNGILDAALDKVIALTPTNAMNKAQGVADQLWGSFRDGRAGAFGRLQAMVRDMDKAKQYAAPLALLLTPAHVERLVATANDATKSRELLNLMRSQVADALTKLDGALPNYAVVKLAKSLTGNEQLTGINPAMAAMEKMSWPARMARKAEREKKEAAAKVQAAKVATVEAKRAGAAPITAKTEPVASKVDDGVRLNEQSTPAGVQSTANAVPDEAAMKAASDYIAKVLGPKVAVEFSNTFKHAGAWIDTKNLIKLSTAKGPGLLTVAHHEALHALFTSLVKNHPETAALLERVMGSDDMKARLEGLLAKEPAALKAITTGPHAAEERVAYAFQFWVAGMLDIDREPKTVFDKIRRLFRKVFGLVRDSEVARDILVAFHDGKMAEPSAAGKVIKAAMDRQTWNEDVKRKWDKQLQAIHYAVGVSNDVLRNETLSETARKLAYTMFTNPGEEAASKHGEGYLNAREGRGKQYSNQLNNIIGTRTSLTERDRTDVITNLQLGTEPKDIPYAPVSKAVKDVYALLERYHQYAIKAGLALEHDGKNYFPRIWDLAKLVEDGGKDKFTAMLNQPKYDKVLDNILGTINAEHALVGKAAITKDEVIDAMHRQLIDRGGVDENGMDAERAHDDLVLNPFFASQRERNFKWIEREDVEPFLEKDLVGAMSRYLHQGVRAAEFARRFGNGGVRLKEMLAMKGDKTSNVATTGPDGNLRIPVRDTHGTIAAEIEASLKAKGVPEDQAAKILARHMANIKNAVAAQEGSLGGDISPTFRKLSSAAMAYQNLRLLPMSLFAAFGDVAALGAGGGGAKAAFEGFQNGIRDVILRWKDALSDVPAQRKRSMFDDMAEAAGSVDSHMMLEQVGKAHTSEFMTDFARNSNRKLFIANGLTAWDRSMRVTATKFAALFLADHAALPDKTHSRRWLAELGLQPKDVPLDREGKLIWDRHVLAAETDQTGMNDDEKAAVLGRATEQMEKVHIAIRRFVQRSVLSPNAAQRPAWGSDPRFAVLFHLKQFTYSMQHVVIKRAMNEATHGNMNPIGALAAAVPTMIASDMLKGMIQGGGSLPGYMVGWNAGDWIADGFQRAGNGGVMQFGVDALHDPSSLFGPTVEQITKTVLHPADILQNLHDAIPLGRMIHGVPDVGKALD